MRTKITLACTECKQRNYNMTKDKKTHPDRMETQTVAVLFMSIAIGVMIAVLDFVMKFGLSFIL